MYIYTSEKTTLKLSFLTPFYLNQTPLEIHKYDTRYSPSQI